MGLFPLIRSLDFFFPSPLSKISFFSSVVFVSSDKKKSLIPAPPLFCAELLYPLFQTYISPSIPENGFLDLPPRFSFQKRSRLPFQTGIPFSSPLTTKTSMSYVRRQFSQNRQSDPPHVPPIRMRACADPYPRYFPFSRIGLLVLVSVLVATIL